MKTFITILVLVIIIGGGIYYFNNKDSAMMDTGFNVPVATSTDTTNNQIDTDKDKPETVIGTSVSGNPITAYHYGKGGTELLFVGGIHGGYEWNTSLVAFELMDYLGTNSDVIPENIKVTIIPVLNPDGLNKVVGTTSRFAKADVPTGTDATVEGRFNGNTVDLNRNFDCDWQAEGKWQNKTVSGGTSAFSEPESQAIKKYVEENSPTAVVVWYSSAGGVYSSNCHDGVLAETTKLTKAFASASGYPAHDSFNYYEITGDMVNWLAKIKIPAISVLLTNHTDTEWEKNKKGVEALLKYYAK